MWRLQENWRRVPYTGFFADKSTVFMKECWPRNKTDILCVLSVYYKYLTGCTCRDTVKFWKELIGKLPILEGSGYTGYIRGVDKKKRYTWWIFRRMTNSCWHQSRLVIADRTQRKTNIPYKSGGGGQDENRMKTAVTSQGGGAWTRLP